MAYVAAMRYRVPFCAASTASLLLAGCATFQAKPLEATQTAAVLEARTLGDPDLKAFMGSPYRTEFLAR